MSWNKNNPAIRRIHADVKELSKNASPHYRAVPLEENMFEWHFAIRGPKGTDYEGGKYHGRILLPADYPFKPPAIIFLTPNGRWKTKEKICLSISNYHPEQWQPAWGIRTILEAIISFMNAPGDGALGAIEVSSEERKRLAQESKSYVHPLMPELPELDQNQDLDSQDKSLNNTENNQLLESNSSDATEVNCLQSLNSNEESEAIIDQVSELENFEINTSEIPSTSSDSSRENDTVDKLLGQLSMALLISIFALLYRKALQMYT